MTYMEHIFICLAAPMLVGAVCAGKKNFKFFIFLVTGYGMCLLSAYMNSFFVGLYKADVITAAVEIAPVVEETLKLFPLLFYLFVFNPHAKDAQTAIITIGVGFTTFENACYLIEHGASMFFHLLIRGFGTGSMHIVCAVIVGNGLIYVWKRTWLKFAGTVGLLCAAITYHAIYNLFVSSSGKIQMIGYVFPMITIIAVMIGMKRISKKNNTYP